MSKIKDRRTDAEMLRDLSNKRQKNTMNGRPRGGPGMARIYAEKPKNMGATVKKLAGYIGRSRSLVLILIAVMLVVTVLNLLAPSVMRGAIDAMGKGDGKGFDMRQVVAALIGLGVLYGVSSALTYLQGISAARLSQKTVYSMRGDLFAKVTRLPLKFIDSHPHGDIMSRITNDVENVSNAVSQSLASLISSVITLIGSLAFMLAYSPRLTLVSLVTIPLTVGASAGMSKLMRKFFIRQQRLIGALNSEIEETVTGYRTVVAYGREKQSIDEFQEVNTELRRTGIFANIFGSVMGPMMNMIGNIGFLAVSVAGGFMAYEHAITIGTITAFIQYSKQFTRPINEIANQYSTLITAVAGAERVFEIIDSADEFEGDAPETSAIADVRGDLDFNAVNFAYKQGEPVLKNFELHVRAGQKIAIVGRTGSGKTTVVNLLTRFYEIDSGSIMLDGTDIRNISKKSLRDNIGIVLQDTVLFSDTVAANIKYGRGDATDEELRDAARTANADLFIERLPEGYDTVLASSGSNLSEGQRQLLAIARAVLSDPKILILDEATSSVDTRTEMQIQSAMIKLMKGRTSLIIAHRLSTIRDADMIIVLADGHIVESGSHEELLAAGGQYHDLYMTQFAGVET